MSQSDVSSAAPADRAQAVLRRLAGSGIEIDASERRRREYSYDASNYRVRPELVAFPRTVTETREVLAASVEFGLSVTVRGGGTSMAGNAVGTGVVVDLSRRLRTIDEIDPANDSVWVDSGVVLSELRAHVERATAGKMTFAPDPSSHTRATIGGSIGNDACGNHSVEYGRMSHHVHEIELLTVDGAHLIAAKGGVRAVDPADGVSSERAESINRRLEALARSHLVALRTELATIPRQVSGYHLANLLPENGFDVSRAIAGTEGTCALIVRARVGLVPKPGPTALLCVGYDSTIDSARDVTTMLAAKPSAIEGLDSSIVALMLDRRGPDSVRDLPRGRAYVMVEFSSDTIEAATERCGELLGRLQANGRLVDHVVVTEPGERAALWRVREDGAGLSSKRVDGVQTWPGWEDSAVAPERLADYLAELLPLIERHGFTASMYGHFGAGCVHMRVDFDFRGADGRASFAAFIEDAAELVTSYGGSLSGEHGDGRARGVLLDRMYSPEMIGLFAAFKAVWDPEGRLNPGIIVSPAPLLADLSLQGMPSPVSSLDLLDASGKRRLPTFVGESHACIGVGRCRSTSGGFMCPSYRATGDEKDSTRGRARVLQELVRGQGHSEGGWRSPEVREALDLCLSCKACSADCPTGVDMAEAKSELMQDHYRRRIRPFTHYSIGWLPRWLPLITRVSHLANLGAKIPVFRWVGEHLGISARRRLPAFQPHRALREQLREAAFAADEHADVLVFPDSFTKAFRPEVIPAAARVLRSSGASVGCTPDACCGLTWISTGQREAAARRLANLVEVLDDGTDRDIVVLEPSCAAAIRDEGPKMVGNEAALRVASRVRSFAVAVDEAMRRGWRPETPPPANVVLQTHCHEHAVFGSASQKRVLSSWGVPHVSESSSCCGVAGNFGFEAEHFDLSMRVAEHSIIPAMRAGGPDSVILTDGFSCAMQVAQIDPGRGSSHLAIAMDAEHVADDQ